MYSSLRSIFSLGAFAINSKTIELREDEFRNLKNELLEHLLIIILLEISLKNHDKTNA